MSGAIARDTGVIIFAKPPVRGEVKTRLASDIGPDRAAALARAFLEDTWSFVRGLSWADAVLATTSVGLFDVRDLDRKQVWLQGEGDVGQRIESMLQRALKQWARAIALGADTPGLPLRLLEQAREGLRTTDAVLGPTDDGGFYLIGLRRCPEGLLRNLPWSQEDTFATTFARLERSGLTVTALERWFDVDRWEDLRRLRDLFEAGVVTAPATQKVLHSFRTAEGAP